MTGGKFIEFKFHCPQTGFDCHTDGTMASQVPGLFGATRAEMNTCGRNILSTETNILLSSLYGNVC